MNFDSRAVPTHTQPLERSLTAIEAAQLVRRSPDAFDDAYTFKHALVQDTAYSSLIRHDRKRLHGLVARALEQLEPEHRAENAALLAFHYENAEEWEPALDYLLLAAERAHRAVAPREELALLARALPLAQRLELTEQQAKIHACRGKALAGITRWADAAQAFKTALALTPAERAADRAGLLIDYALALAWLEDMDQAAAAALEARELALRAHRPDLETASLTTRAMGESISGDLQSSVRHFDEAFQGAPDLKSAAHAQGLEVAALTHYWLGNYPAALARNREAVNAGREISDPVAIMRGLSNIGLTLVGMGEYRAAFKVFDEARAFGQQHDLGAWLSRQIAIESGCYLQLFDYARSRELAVQARDTARQYKFIVAIASPAVDLLFNFARSGQLAHAARIEYEVREILPRLTGSHNWLVGMRFLQARAELAAAREDWERARALANESLDVARQHGRVKYQVWALVTRSQALIRCGQGAAARQDAHTAVQLARKNADPALLLRAGLALYALEPSDVLAQEIRVASRRIAAQLDDTALRSRFEAVVSEWI